jgi:hypothetical protein
MRLCMRLIAIACAGGLTLVSAPALGAMTAAERHAPSKLRPVATSQNAGPGVCGGISVGSPSVAVSADTRRSLGLHAWPDTALGLLPKSGGGYHFLAVNVPTLEPPQLIAMSTGTLNNPVAGDLDAGKVPGSQVRNKPAEYKYVGGGPVYKDAASGLILQVLHMERNWVNPITGVDDKYHVVLDLAVFDPETGVSTRLGPIVRPDIDFDTARRLNMPVDIGTSTITAIGGHLYVYFPDLRANADDSTSATALSVARAPLAEVIEAARVGKVSAWHKYKDGVWDQPALGGASSDIQPGAAMAEHPNVARSTSLDASIMVTSLGARQMELSSSANGITGWSKRHPLFRDTKYMNVYPTVVGADGDPSDPGASFILYYTQFGEGWDWRTARLMKRTITCTAGRQAGTVKFARYVNGSKHMVTSGAAADDYREDRRWYLSSVQQSGTEALYGCRNGVDDHFVSKDPGCEGKGYDILRTEGWIYTTRPSAPSTPLYRCHVPSLGDHFVSSSPDCEANPGGTRIDQEGLLGYALLPPVETVKFVRYYNGLRHKVTSGPAGDGYRAEGHWYLTAGQQSDTEALYGCRNGVDDHFVSKDPGCEGAAYVLLRREGWIYTTRPSAPSTPLYRCHVPSLGDHFVSSSPDCEAKPGGTRIDQEGLLGYALNNSPDET